MDPSTCGIPRQFTQVYGLGHFRGRQEKILGVGCGPTTPRATPGDTRVRKCNQDLSFLVDPSAPKYHHAGSRNGLIRCQAALWNVPAVSPSLWLPAFCTWALRWPALGPTLNARFGMSEWLPGPFWLGWAGAGPGSHGALGGRLPLHTHPPPPMATRATPGVTKLYHFSFLVDASVPKYRHAGPRNCVIRCQPPLRSGPAVPPSLWLPGLCAWSLRWPAMGPTLNA